MGRHTVEWVILTMALLGVLVAAYGVTLHYAPAGSAFCNITANINCDKVNKSPWSEIMGVPVAAFGALAYFAVFLVVLKRRAIARWLSFSDKDVFQYLLYLVLVMLAFQLYLTYTEVAIIRAYCIICIASQVFIAAIAYMVGHRYRNI